MKDELFNRHIEAARHSLQAVRERLRASPAAPGREIAGQLDDIGAALDAAALEWAQQRDALAALQINTAEGARMEEAMRLGEGQLSGFFHASPAGLAVLDTELRYLRINERLAAMNGQPMEAHLGKTVREILPAFAPIIEPLCRQVLLTGKPVLDHEFGRETTRAAGMDGDWIISYFPVPDRNGTPAALGVVVTDISARKQAEARLRESEEQYRRLFENSMLAISQTSLDGRLVRVNMAYARMYGYASPEQMIAAVSDMGHQLYADPEDRKEVLRILSEKGVMGPREMAVVRRDGTRFDVEVLAQEIRDVSGRLLCYQASHVDITERKRAEEAVRKSEERYRSLFDNMAEGCAYCRMLFEDGRPQDFIYLAVNHAFEKLTELRDVVGKKVSVVIPSIRETDPELFEIYGRVALTGQPERFETFLKVLDMWLSISVYSPAKEHFVTVFDVITERKRAEAALRESEARLRALFENTMVGILLTAPDGHVFAANPAACRMFGRTETDICRLGRSGLVNRRDPRVNVLVQERAEKGYAAGELTLTRSDGTCFPAQVSSAVFETAEGPRTSMVIQDLTERKQAEARIRDFSRKLLTVREEEKRSISAVLHHDVGSFTVGVTAYLNAAEEDLRKGKDKEALASLKKARRLFVQSVRRLKKLALELRPPDLDILGLPAALRQHFALLTDEASLRIRFTDATYGRTIPPEVQTVLFRVVQESLNNVVKHAHARQVRVRLSAPRKTFRLSIVDDGKGFDPVRAAAKSGTHLGLAVAREMVVALGGEFLVDAAPGRGTTVLVTVPPGGPKT